jgi:hypothetical protein
MNYTATQARHDYPPNLKRAAVIQLGERCGLTRTTVRTLIEGPAAPLKPRLLAGQKYGYFLLEDAIKAFFPDSTN